MTATTTSDPHAVSAPDSPLRRAVSRWGSNLSAYATLLQTMWAAHRLWTVLALLSAVAGGLLPNLMIVASGFLVGALPDAVRQGFGSAAGSHAVWALILFGFASVGHAVAVATFRLSIHQLACRYVPYVEDLLAQATLAPDRVDHLEDPAVAAKISAASEASRENIHLNTVDMFLNIVQSRTGGLAAAALLISFHWWAPILVLAGIVVLNRCYAGWQNAAFANLFTITGTERRRAEYLRGLAMDPGPAKEIRMFGLADWLVGRYVVAWTSAMRSVWDARRRLSWKPIMGCVGLLVSNIVLIGILAYQAVHGDVSVGVITVVVQALGMTIMSLGLMGGMSWIAIRGARTIQEILQLRKDLAPFVAEHRGVADDDRSVSDPTSEPAAVSLRDVRFSYPSRTTPTLDGLTLEIPAGQSVAIVGENGAGKSTLIKLLCGFYLPDAGTVALDGRSTDTADLERLRRRIAVIFQDFVRYQLPLKENVGFGHLPGIDDQDALQRVIAAAGGTALAEQIGWDTILSAAYPSGTDLSGGQWQRVALARALAALDGGAGLLILDEPTAALDVRAEVELFDRFLEVTGGATTILVSHRLSSVRHADRIVVLADGRIVEDGSHDQLMVLGGRYARMFSLQAQRFGNPEGSGDHDA